MISLVIIFIPILLTDIINPVLLAAVIFALGSKRPYLNAMMALAGWFVVYYISGVVLALGLDAIIDFLANPRPIDFYIETVIAILLIWLGIRIRQPEKNKRKAKDFDDSDSLKPSGAFFIGASINLIGLPFAIPYFAALDQILKADLDWIPSLTALFIYNLLYILPFAVIIIIRRIYREQSDPILQKINEWMEKIGSILMPLMLFLLAIALLVDAIYYFVTGLPLY
jgi:threonine/homoserine/homoserine lactone efflux protein